jgi:hypothetical protein
VFAGQDQLQNDVLTDLNPSDIESIFGAGQVPFVSDNGRRSPHWTGRGVSARNQWSP